MFRNYLLTAWRNMRRNKLFTVLNVLGLAGGLACGILIFLWVGDELSYDRFNPGADRIFRLVETVKDIPTVQVPSAFAGAIKDLLPQAKNATHIYSTRRVLSAGARKFEEEQVFYADTNFLRVFHYPLLRGDRSAVLRSPGSVVLTAAAAIKYFGSVDKAMGSPLFDETDSVMRQVTGILHDVPTNSHLQFDLLLPAENWLRHVDPTQRWRYFDSYTYLQLADGVSGDESTVRTMETQLNGIRDKAIVHTPAVPATLTLQRLTDVHLRSHFKNDVDGMGNIQNVRLFTLVAIFILVIACINFMNLATALSGTRAKEVGLRKTIGAQRRQLVGQFLSESLLLSIAALGFALLLVYLSLPFFNRLTSKSIQLDLLNVTVLGKMLGIAVFTGLLAGIYPAFYLSSFNAIEVLKGRFNLRGKGSVLRNGLVVLQFSIAVVLMISTVIVYEELQLLHNRDIGFDRDNLLYISLPATSVVDNGASTLKRELLRSPLVKDVTSSWELPSYFHASSPLSWRGMEAGQLVIVTRIGVDEDYLRTMGMRLAAGRFFITGGTNDSAYVLNETAARAMGMDPASVVGKLITLNGRESPVIGVVKDFNFKPVYQAVEPLVMKYSASSDYLIIRSKAGAGLLPAVQERFRSVYGNLSLNYGFVDEELDRLYQSETRTGLLFRLFSLLAIGISCMGLFGLATFATRRRAREIGVRKVLGASEGSVVILLVREFLTLVAVALLVAFPAAWYAMHLWLQGFVYKVTIHWWVFALSGATALFVAFLTVGYQTIRTAMAKPVKSLRAE